MICESCHGTGWWGGRLTGQPCRQCGGTGRDHCCDPAGGPDDTRNDH